MADQSINRCSVVETEGQLYNLYCFINHSFIHSCINKYKALSILDLDR